MELNNKIQQIITFSTSSKEKRYFSATIESINRALYTYMMHEIGKHSVHFLCVISSSLSLFIFPFYHHRHTIKTFQITLKKLSHVCKLRWNEWARDGEINKLISLFSSISMFLFSLLCCSVWIKNHFLRHLHRKKLELTLFFHYITCLVNISISIFLNSLPSRSLAYATYSSTPLYFPSHFFFFFSFIHSFILTKKLSFTHFVVKANEN